jgi:hypothetical protein
MFFICLHLANDNTTNRDGNDIIQIFAFTITSFTDFALAFNHNRDYYDFVYVGF